YGRDLTLHRLQVPPRRFPDRTVESCHAPRDLGVGHERGSQRPRRPRMRPRTSSCHRTSPWVQLLAPLRPACKAKTLAKALAQYLVPDQRVMVGPGDDSHHCDDADAHRGVDKLFHCKGAALTEETNSQVVVGNNPL